MIFFRRACCEVALFEGEGENTSNCLHCFRPAWGPPAHPQLQFVYPDLCCKVPAGASAHFKNCPDFVRSSCCEPSAGASAPFQKTVRALVAMSSASLFCLSGFVLCSCCGGICSLIFFIRVRVVFRVANCNVQTPFFFRYFQSAF